MANQIPEDALVAIEKVIRRQTGAVSASEILRALPTPVAQRTLQYRLKRLVLDKRLIVEGEGRWAKYRLADMGSMSAAKDDERFVMTLSNAAQAVRAGARYAAIRQSLGEPDPFRLRYRVELRELIADLIRRCTTRPEAVRRIAVWADQRIAPVDRSRFVEVTEAELTGLHEGNFARYQIRPSEFAAWRKVWQEK